MFLLVSLLDSYSAVGEDPSLAVQTLPWTFLLMVNDAFATDGPRLRRGIPQAARGHFVCLNCLEFGQEFLPPTEGAYTQWLIQDGMRFDSLAASGSFCRDGSGRALDQPVVNRGSCFGFVLRASCFGFVLLTWLTTRVLRRAGHSVTWSDEMVKHRYDEMIKCYARRNRSIFGPKPYDNLSSPSGANPILRMRLTAAVNTGKHHDAVCK
ncbi:hypothetical protein E2P81_ATG03195 [Venturia nashicola]|uniref:Uncharacterized protein n=1 Tax=Venturia nashicola TaxID=86259 RepID=A0A4Z1P9L4_9PEZI|nr:hypothetical protein E6O75_ATG03265 [Venturia nashicola]TLD36306.1 hypothetical protein E2P81_ATG03195 [Venturia nashicola]